MGTASTTGRPTAVGAAVFHAPAGDSGSLRPSPGIAAASIGSVTGRVAVTTDKGTREAVPAVARNKGRVSLSEPGYFSDGGRPNSEAYRFSG